MTLGHFVYIPALVLLGMVFGYILAGRVASNAKADRLAQAKQRIQQEQQQRNRSGGL